MDLNRIKIRLIQEDQECNAYTFCATTTHLYFKMHCFERTEVEKYVPIARIISVKVSS